VNYTTFQLKQDNSRVQQSIYYKIRCPVAVLNLKVRDRYQVSAQNPLYPYLLAHRATTGYIELYQK
jgi:hypothetical protein